jgi:hypothetical protein
MVVRLQNLGFGFVVACVMSSNCCAQGALPNLSPTRALTTHQWREAGCFSPTIASIADRVLVENGGHSLGTAFYSDEIGRQIRPEVVTSDDTTINAATNARVNWLGLRVTGIGKSGLRENYRSNTYIYVSATPAAVTQTLRRANMPINSTRTGSSYEVQGLRGGIVKITCFLNAGSAGFSD